MHCNRICGRIGRPLVVADAMSSPHLKAISNFPTYRSRNMEKYTDSLAAEARRRYIDKTAVIGGQDPNSPTCTMLITAVRFQTSMMLEIFHGVEGLCVGKYPFPASSL